jgi:hypothetical protein
MFLLCKYFRRKWLVPPVSLLHLSISVFLSANNSRSGRRRGKVKYITLIFEQANNGFQKDFKP